MASLEQVSLRVGISACLLGQPVRYDGGHKRHRRLVEELGRHVEWVPVCPEVELGLGVPRETIDLVALPSGEVRLRASQTGRDLTAAMTRYAAGRVAALVAENVAGYVFKSKSPSCGVAGVPVIGAYGDAGAGRGLFAMALLARLPGLPVVEEHQVETARDVEDFLARVRDYAAGGHNRGRNHTA